MTRSGTTAASRGPNPHKTSSPQTDRSAVVPEPVVDFAAYGLRPTAAGYQLVRVDVAGESVTITPLRQAEPQRAVANAYLESAVADSYLEGRG